MINNKIYENLINNLTEGVYFVDTHKKITFWNKSAEDITGYTSSEVVNKKFSETKFKHLDHEGVELPDNMCPLISTIKYGINREVVTYAQHKDGYRIPLTVKTLPVYEDQKILGCMAIFSVTADDKRIIKDVAKYKNLAHTDQLTKLSNRLYGLEFLKSREIDYNYLGSEFGIIMLDIDHFKKVNDTYGHDVGDIVLKRTAEIMLKEIRKEDLMCRWGGEEFLGVIRVDNEAGLHIVGEKIRRKIENDVIVEGGNLIKVTISVGGSMYNGSIDGTIKEADNMLYEAKNTGRNKVVIQKK